MSQPSNTRDQDARAARAFSSIMFGDGWPLVPDEAQGQDTSAVIAATLRRLTDMRRPRARVLYHRAPGTPPKKGSLP